MLRFPSRLEIPGLEVLGMSARGAVKIPSAELIPSHSFPRKAESTGPGAK